jgi:hypothetical protein
MTRHTALSIALVAAAALAFAGAASGQTPAGPRPYNQAFPAPKPAKPAPPQTVSAAKPPAPARVSNTPPDVPLRGLQQYRHPAIPASACRLVNAGRKDCVIPAMTAGRYLIQATGSSMSMGPKARQQLTIIVANRACAKIANFTPWTGTTRGVTATCEVSILSDEPVVISIVYADSQALKVASGPAVIIERGRWNGVLEMREIPPPTP